MVYLEAGSLNYLMVFSYKTGLQNKPYWFRLCKFSKSQDPSKGPFKIYPDGLRGGPKTIKNTAAKEPAKSCEGAQKRIAEGKTQQKLGFSDVSEIVKNIFAVLAGRI